MIDEDTRSLWWYGGWLIAGIVILVWWWYMIWRSLTPSDDDISPIVTQDILEDTISLPPICQDTLSLLNCMMWHEGLIAEQWSLNQYYQQLISQRNIIETTDLITQECTSQYRYISTLQYTGYTQVIQSCIQ